VSHSAALLGSQPRQATGRVSCSGIYVQLQCHAVVSAVRCQELNISSRVRDKPLPCPGLDLYRGPQEAEAVCLHSTQGPAGCEPVLQARCGGAGSLRPILRPLDLHGATARGELLRKPSKYTARFYAQPYRRAASLFTALTFDAGASPFTQHYSATSLFSYFTVQLCHLYKSPCSTPASLPSSASRAPSTGAHHQLAGADAGPSEAFRPPSIVRLHDRTGSLHTCTLACWRGCSLLGGA